MATYAFETITAEQALAIAASDTLTLAGGPARLATVLYAADNATITLVFGERSVVFGPALTAVSLGGRLTLADGSRLFIGDSQANTFALAADSTTHDAAYAGAGDDSIDTGGGDDLLQGNMGTDTLSGGAGADAIYGGQDNDRILTGAGANFAQGNKGDDAVLGGAGRDTLLGGQGADTIDGDAGASDFLNGNLGDDVITVRGGGDVFGEDGADTITTADSANVSTLISAGAGNDRVLSQATFGLSQIHGDDGDDFIAGGGAATDLGFGDAGRDTLIAGAGDEMHGGEGDDSLSTSASNVLLAGDAGNDVIRAEQGRHTIDGGDGDDDIITFSDSSETIRGGAGNDTIYADRAGDKLVEGGAGADNLQLGTGAVTANGGDGDDFMLTQRGSRSLLRGEGGADRLAGEGSDTLDGGAGDDWISPRGGLDAMIGGSGSDTFSFASFASQRVAGQIDRILDWTTSDRIEVEGISRAAMQYSEQTAPDLTAAFSQYANLGVNSVVAVQVGADVVLFSSFNISGFAAEPLILVGRSLADISIDNFV